MYKLVQYGFAYLPTNTATGVLKSLQRDFFQLTNEYYRRLYCTVDKWHGMSMEDIRKLEESAQKELLDALLPKEQ